MTESRPDQDPDSVALTRGGRTIRVLKPGDVIGDSYVVKGLIGRGGMGYVFRVQHRIIKKDCALKILAPDQINEITWNRFQSEGKAIARLDHPNIVKIYDMGVEGSDFPYYVMDILEGVSLAECIADRKPLAVDVILDIFIQLASGFGYAHSRGIVHRDVKPSNVMLVETGSPYPRAKIVDFGIAKLEGRGLEGQSQTAAGDLFGSPYYMSPEQCLGENIDQRSDIYSLGCTLFEALCGCPPFVGESAVQTMIMHQNRPSPTIESVGGKYSSREMEALVARMLAKRPAERYQSMDLARHDLERVRQNKAVGKNVETGFRSSVESQLEEIGSKLEVEKLGEARRGKILAGLIAFVGVLAVAVAVYVFVCVKKPGARAPAAANYRANLPSMTEQTLVGAEKDQALIDAEKLFAGVKEITSTIDKRSGKRIFHLPYLHMGFLCWWNPPAGKELVFPEVHFGRTDAYGDAAVPAGLDVLLAIDQIRNRETFYSPEVLEKFGPREFFGLKLWSRVPLYETITDREQENQKKMVTALARAVSSWKNLQMFELMNEPATIEALEAVARHRELRILGLTDCQIDQKKVSQMPFLKQLVFLNLDDMENCDLLVLALKGSKALKSLSLVHSTISAHTLASLASCSNLKYIFLENTKIDNQGLVALASIKSLNQLILTEEKIYPEQLPLLAKFRSFKRLEFSAPNWSEADLLKLHEMLPNAELRNPPANPEVEEHLIPGT